MNEMNKKFLIELVELLDKYSIDSIVINKDGVDSFIEFISNEIPFKFTSYGDGSFKNLVSYVNKFAARNPKHES